MTWPARSTGTHSTLWASRGRAGRGRSRALHRDEEHPLSIPGPRNISLIYKTKQIVKHIQPLYRAQLLSLTAVPKCLSAATKKKQPGRAFDPTGRRGQPAGPPKRELPPGRDITRVCFTRGYMLRGCGMLLCSSRVLKAVTKTPGCLHTISAVPFFSKPSLRLSPCFLSVDLSMR